jgi:type II secretory pathway pseudopilin PulG
MRRPLPFRDQRPPAEDSAMSTRLAPPSTRRSRLVAAERGFTILELLIFLVMITLTATFAIWAYFARPEVTLENAAELLARDIRFAQHRSALIRGPVSLVFYDQGDGYRLVDGDEADPRADKRRDRVDRRYSRDATFEGVRILPMGLAADERIVFEGADFEGPSGRIALTYGDHNRLLEIESGTGKIVLSESSTSAGFP